MFETLLAFIPQEYHSFRGDTLSSFPRVRPGISGAPRGGGRPHRAASRVMQFALDGQPALPYRATYVAFWLRRCLQCQAAAQGQPRCIAVASKNVGMTFSYLS